MKYQSLRTLVSKSVFMPTIFMLCGMVQAKTVTVIIKSQFVCGEESVCISTDNGKYRANFFALSKSEKALLAHAAKEKRKICLMDVASSSGTNYFEHVAAACTDADWDHEKNVTAGVRKFVSAYKAGGISNAQSEVESCYQKIDKKTGNAAQLKFLEYCAGMDLAAYRLDDAMAKKNGWPPTYFFTINSVSARVNRIKRYIPDLELANKTVKTWTILAANALN